jgi:hypothetical protein
VDDVVSMDDEKDGSCSEAEVAILSLGIDSPSNNTLGSFLLVSKSVYNAIFLQGKASICRSTKT